MRKKIFYIDALVIALVSVLISLAAEKLYFMTVAVPVIILFRMVLVFRENRKHGESALAEIFFFVLCVLLGAFNDWNSVVNKKIYEYSVPVFFPEFSTVPVWMLLFWGMILRFFSGFVRWDALNPSTVSDRVGIGRYYISSAPLKVALELAIIFATRQCIYRYYEHALLSWIPFVCALLIILIFFYPSLHDLKLILIFLAGGPLIEILYIHAGGLHHYKLGWIFGIPVWLALWWMLIIIIWKDISFRIENIIKEAVER